MSLYNILNSTKPFPSLSVKDIETQLINSKRIPESSAFSYVNLPTVSGIPINIDTLPQTFYYYSDDTTPTQIIFKYNPSFLPGQIIYFCNYNSNIASSIDVYVENSLFVAQKIAKVPYANVLTLFKLGVADNGRQGFFPSLSTFAPIV